ncbi:L,D-transpeptidase family protein [Myxococcota bacterium]|nr:L,D-transpeptidase family protein [Myxococcota bacterium]
MSESAPAEAVCASATAAHATSMAAAIRRTRNRDLVALVVIFVVPLCFSLACVRGGSPEPDPEDEFAGVVPAPAAPSTEKSAATAAPAVDPLALPCESVERIEVRKRVRQLEAWCVGGGRRVFEIGLSRVPFGAKRRRGDQRMPEGEYRIAGAARPSRFHLFLPIDYPSVADAERGLAAGEISRAVYRRILRAHAENRMPPQDTVLGGLLGFHGEGPRWRGELDLEWTEGCVAVTDETIRWLGARAPKGTRVSILP